MFKIINGSAADLPVELLASNSNIDLFHSVYMMKQKQSNLDGVTLESVTLLAKMREGAVIEHHCPHLKLPRKIVS